MSTSAAMSPIWKVPYRRNPFFTGGEEVLSRLHAALQQEGHAALSQPQGVSGLGGIGKTQLALEYAYRYRARYKAILWIRADSASILTSEFVAVALLLDLPEQDEQDERVIVEAVLHWLRQQEGWLLVLDNVEDLAVVEPFVPKTGRGHILLTTRVRSFGALAHRIEVQKMEPEIGALFLLRRASILPLQISLEAADHEARTLSSKISQVLDGLPLALDQAGAYIKETPCGLREYLERYQTRRQELLRARGSLDEDYPASVATTWSLSFEKVMQANPASAQLLDFCAFLSPDAIPEAMITGGASSLGPLLQPVAVDPVLFDQSLAVLLAYSLIARNADDNVLSIHRLVQAVLRDAMPAETGKQWKRRAVSVVNIAFPHVEYAWWAACESCLPHALTCATWIEQQFAFSEQFAISDVRLLNQAGSYLIERARYTEAESLFQLALTIREQRLGAEHPDTALSLHNLGALYEKQGNYAEAEPLLKQALAIREQQLGAEHPDTAFSLNSLASFYYLQGRYAEAEPLFKRALTFYEQQLGAEYPAMARCLNNLAALYMSQGRYAEAEPLFQRALTIREQQLGPLHPDTAESLNNLATLYYLQGNYAEAEPLFKRALTFYEQQLGTEHPKTATSLGNLAALYHLQGNYAEAEPLLKRALAITEQHLGAEHPDTARSLNNLAVLYRSQGNYAEAEPLFKRALTFYEQQLGTEHPYTLKVRENYVSLLQTMGRGAQTPLLEPESTQS